jgi:alkyl sulfatase BDS1-like metallo-beta-lactamase superfamily hydrolase
MGGADKILARGQELIDQGKYRHAQEILNKLVYAEPDNQAAKDLLADAFEQFGYQQESPSVRNSFLGAAYELRSGIPEGISPKTLTPDVINQMTTEMFLDFVGILLDSRKAEGMKFTINMIVPDEGTRYVVELSNETLTNIEGRSAANPDLTLTVDKKLLMAVMMGQGTFAQYIESGDMKADGDLSVIQQLKSTMTRFDPLFELMPGTKKK